MALFDLFRRTSPKPEPQPAPQPPQGSGTRHFERDPARMFDTAKTAALAHLFAVPSEQRDADWIDRFWAAAWTAALVLPEPPIAPGPDGFPYLRLHLPAQGASYEANSLMNLASGLVEQGAGAAFFAAAGADMADAEYVVPMGVLDSILRFDHPGGEPSELDEVRSGTPTANRVTTLPAGEQILVGTPSPDFLSPAAARALHRHLAEDWGLAEPRVAILVSPSLCPSRSLVVGQSRSALLAKGATEAQIAGWMERIGWFLPPSRGLMLMPDGWSVEEMTPLRELF